MGKRKRGTGGDVENAMQIESEFMTVEEIANLCRVSRQTVLNWIDEGVLKARKLGADRSRVVRVLRDEYTRFAKGV
jgi:excisionase family DNA binding protein